MNNFMPSNLPQQFFNPSGGNSGSNYSYDINLNAVNKSGVNNASGSQSSNVAGGRSNQNDYDTNPKNIYKSNKSAHSQQRADQMQKSGGTGISSGGNNIIMEMEAEQNDDESYYLSNSPARRGMA